MIKNLIFLFGFSAFATFVWIGLSVYHSSVTSQITPANQMKIEPIEPAFDTQAIEQINMRQEINTNLNDTATIISEDSELLINESSESGTLDTQDLSTSSAIFE